MPDPLHAKLEWDAEGLPSSTVFDDVYFSKANGLAETRYVFLQHNGFPERFAKLAPNSCCTLGETGFGTGLNFLCTYQAFLAEAPPTAQLHFISVEKFPLSATDLKQALALWPELAELAAELCAQYQAVQPGFQHFIFAEGRVRLTLIIDDAIQGLAQLDAQVDAWFLDGFAPAKNPDMWNQQLFQQLARLSHPHTTLATFTSAGFVRRGLIAAGFAMQRCPGFGTKREMLQGQFNACSLKHSPLPAWFARPHAMSTVPQAIVIGAGLAGAASAYSLAIRGWQVQVLDQAKQVASAASGNHQGVLYLKLSAHGTALTELVLAGFGYTRRWLSHQLDASHWDACGVLQLAHNSKAQARQQELTQCFPDSLVQALSAEQASTQAGIPLDKPALFYPESGWVSPRALCQALLTHPNIQLHLGQSVDSLKYHQQQWQLYAQQHLLAQAPVLIVANAHQAQHFAQTAHLPLKPIRGQTTTLRPSAQSRPLQTVVCAEGYITPPYLGLHTCGASFDFQQQHSQLTPSEQQQNLQHVAAINPDLAASLATTELSGHAAFRCTTPDYLPLIGPVAEPEAFLTDYAALRKNAKRTLNAPCTWQTGLFVNLGHGSRGLISAPLAGELLAAWITQEALPVSHNLAQACHPNRFLVRQLMKNL